MDLARFEFEAEVLAMQHLMVSLQVLIRCLQAEGPQPEIAEAADFLCSELESQVAEVCEAVRCLGTSGDGQQPGEGQKL